MGRKEELVVVKRGIMTYNERDMKGNTYRRRYNRLFFSLKQYFLHVRDGNFSKKIKIILQEKVI